MQFYHQTKWSNLFLFRFAAQRRYLYIVNWSRTIDVENESVCGLVFATGTIFTYSIIIICNVTLNVLCHYKYVYWLQFQYAQSYGQAIDGMWKHPKRIYSIYDYCHQWFDWMAFGRTPLPNTASNAITPQRFIIIHHRNSINFWQ